MNKNNDNKGMKRDLGKDTDQTLGKYTDDSNSTQQKATMSNSPSGSPNRNDDNQDRDIGEIEER